MDKIVLVTGGYDPLHSGHINLFDEASKIGQKLVVGINSDRWLIRKKGFYFLPMKERKIIIENLRMVDKVIIWDDKDNSACGAIDILLSDLKFNQLLVFANGGDRIEKNTPEFVKFKNNKNILFKFGIGGFKKTNSSSLITDKFKKRFL